MHPEVLAEAPGDCPKCGMPLVPVKANKSSRTHETSGTDNHCHQMRMASSVNLTDAMNREGSGTSWLPDSTPVYGRMLMFGDDMLMLHGAIFPRYLKANTRRGYDRIDAPNWFMAMYSHPLGDSAQFGFRGMMSLDLLTEGGRGYRSFFKAARPGMGTRFTTGSIPTICSMKFRSVTRKNLAQIFPRICMRVILASPRWGRRHAPALGHG